MKVEKDKIIAELSKLRYENGYSRGSLVQYLKDNYGLENSRSYELIRDMQNEIGERYNQTKNNALQDSIEFMEKQMQDCLIKGEKKLALEWQKELNKVQQLHIQRMDITSGGDKLTDIKINIIKPDKKEGEDGVNN